MGDIPRSDAAESGTLPGESDGSKPCRSQQFASASNGTPCRWYDAKPRQAIARITREVIDIASMSDSLAVAGPGPSRDFAQRVKLVLGLRMGVLHRDL